MALCAAAAITPAAADAARVRVVGHYANPWECRQLCPPPSFTVIFEAAAGEANDVTVSGDAGGILIKDTRAFVEARGGCTALDPNTVRCRPDAELVVKARDGDDVVTLPTPAGTREWVEAGRGDDRVIGSSRAEILSGGPGDDQLFGGGGDDRLLDAVRRPSQRVSNSDVFDGGEGSDWVEYAGRLAPVTVTLPDAAGGSGESDRLVGVENALGGYASDTLTGDDGPNHLADGGGPGGDLLDGRGGNDRLAGGRAALGGPGRDYFGTIDAPQVRESGRDGFGRIDCGDDRDFVDGFLSTRVIEESCESVLFSADAARQQLPLRDLSDPVVVYDQYDDGYPSEVRLELRAAGVGAFPRHPRAGTLLGEAQARADQVPLRLSERGAALLRRYGRIRARVIRDDPVVRVSYLIDLRMPEEDTGR